MTYFILVRIPDLQDNFILWTYKNSILSVSLRWKNFILSLSLIRVLYIVSFSLETALYSVLTDPRCSFLETTKPLWFSKMPFGLFFLKLRFVKFYNCRSYLLILLLYLEFMLLIDIFYVWLLLFSGTVFVMSKTSMCWLKRSLFHFNFL